MPLRTSRKFIRFTTFVAIAMMALLFIAPTAHAATARSAKPVKGRQVSLPHTITAPGGANWQFQPDGSVGEDLSIGGLVIDNQFNFAPAQQADFDADHNELSLPGQRYRGVIISRRVTLLDIKKGLCRWADIFENTTGAPVTFNITLQCNLPDLQASESITDPKNAKHTLAMAAGSGEVGIAMFGAGHGATLAPNFGLDQNSDTLQMSYKLLIPAKMTVVLVHAAVRRPNYDSAAEAMRRTTDAELLAGLPAELMRKTANFRLGRPSVLDVDVLRGDRTDIIELRSGDQLLGEIEQQTLSLKTAFGDISVKADALAGIVSLGGFRPTQALAFVDGQVITGQLAGPLRLKLADGQTIELPVDQIVRAGWHTRPNEPQDWTLDRPMVMLRGGDQLLIEPLASPIDVATRYGRLQIAPSSLNAITFLEPDSASPFHEIRMKDGTRMAGLVQAASVAESGQQGGQGDCLKLTLGGILAGKIAELPLASIMRVQMGLAVEDPALSAPAIMLANGDIIAGALTGKLTLDTNFATIEINAPEIRSLTCIKGTSADVTVTMWDDSHVQGRLHEAQLLCHSLGGLTINIPLALVGLYEQPRPSPAPSAIPAIRLLAEQLLSDDPAKSSAAHDRLMEIGPAAAGVLRELAAGKSAEERAAVEAVAEALDQSARRTPPEPEPPPVLPTNPQGRFPRGMFGGRFIMG